MTTDVTVACSTTDATDGMHSCQLSRNLRDSPGISGTVPDFLPVSQKGPENLDCPGKALIVPEKL